MGAPATLSATLLDASSNPVAGKSVTLTLAPALATSQSCVGVSNASGVASCTLSSVTVSDGVRKVQASFTTDGTYNSAQASGTVIVNPQPSDILTYSGTTSMTNGSNATVLAVLTDAGSNGLSGRTITFTLAPAYNAQTCSAVTDGTGTASCTISGVNEPVGTRTVHVVFAGDTYPANSLDASVSVANGAADTIVYRGDSTFTDNTAGHLSAVLTDSSNGHPMVGDLALTLALAPAGANQDCTAVTNGSGVASCTIPARHTGRRPG